MADPIIEVMIRRGAPFAKEVVISWPDGAQTSLVNHRGFLDGSDGNKYPVRRGDDHEMVCRQVMEQQGYSFRRR